MSSKNHTAVLNQEEIDAWRDHILTKFRAFLKYGGSPEVSRRAMRQIARLARYTGVTEYEAIRVLQQKIEEQDAVKNRPYVLTFKTVEERVVALRLLHDVALGLSLIHI